MKFKNAAKVLKQFRKDAGLTQAELGIKLDNLHSQHLSNAERGLCFIPKPNLKKMVKVLNLSSNDKMSLMDALKKDYKEHAVKTFGKLLK